MRLVVEYPKGLHLYKGKGNHFPKLPYAMQVWNDPPAYAAQPAADAAPSGTDAPPNSLALHWACSVAGTSASALFDTGAQGSQYISAAFCRQARIKVQPLAAPRDVRGVDGN